MTPLTRRSIGRRSIGSVLREHDSKPCVKVPVDVAVEEPRAGVVGRETNRNVVSRRASADSVTLGRVDVVVAVVSGTANDVEGVLLQHLQY